MTHTTRRLKVLIETVLERHHRIDTAIDELAAAIDDEIEARVRDRVDELRQQLEQEQQAMSACEGADADFIDEQVQGACCAEELWA